MSAIVVIAGSAGALPALREISAALPASTKASVFVVMHIGRNPSILPTLLGQPGPLPAAFAKDGDLIRPRRIVVAPPDHHMRLDPHFIRLNMGPKVHGTRPSADPLFLSAAETFGERVIGIVLSGGDGDGADGLRVIKKRGGTALVQHVEEARSPSMPYAAMMADHPDACLPATEIAQWVHAALLP